MTYRITSRFLEQEPFRTRPHTGIDFAMPENTPLRSIKDGIVERVVDFGSSNIGKGIFIKWQDGKTAIYGHLSKITVKQGDIVKAGDLIGYSGNTGHSTGAHLHFAIKEGGRFIDPAPYIDLIQNMNNPSFLAKMQHTSDTVTLNGLEFAKILSEILSSIKLQFINIFIRDIDYYTFFLKVVKQSLQFLATHAGLFYDSFWRIF